MRSFEYQVKCERLDTLENIVTYDPSHPSVLNAFWRLMFGWMAVLILSLASGSTYAAKPGPDTSAAYSYSFVGNPELASSVTARTHPSYVLMGGGPDVDEAFRWMIQQAGVTPGTGGRLVVIRATGDGAYNPYIYFSNKRKSTASRDIVDGWVGGASLGLTSVETLVIPSAAAANNDFVKSIVQRADAVWIAGGDQSHYIKYWKGSVLENTLNILMEKNVPVGGTSAGLAVLGGFDFTAINGTVTSAQALTDPYNQYMTFDPSPLSTSGGFIAPLALANTILDSHFDSRDRMGRLIGFMSRLINRYPGAGTQLYGCAGGVLGNRTARGIGIGVETALLVAGNPDLTYTGRRVTNLSTTTESAVYFVSVTQGPTVCAAGKPLDIPTSSIQVRKLADGTVINLSDWSGFPVDTSLGVSSGTLLPSYPY